MENKKDEITFNGLGNWWILCDQSLEQKQRSSVINILHVEIIGN
jgi:hypothetical protein